MTQPHIIYFNHCNRVIFALYCPTKCPICFEELGSVEFISLPFPFNKANEYPCAVLIKPTQGDFLSTYVGSDDLHIAVTTSTGDIVEYDALGLRRSTTSSWKQCLMVYQIDEIWNKHWDAQLLSYFSKTEWTAEAYDEHEYNCYSFVISFLRLLEMPGLMKMLENKNVFCAKLILPKTKSAVKYISVYRKLNEEPFVF